MSDLNRNLQIARENLVNLRAAGLTDSELKPYILRYETAKKQAIKPAQEMRNIRRNPPVNCLK